MHPFARFIQVLGKGRNGMRSLSQQEAYEAMHMITCYDVEPEQLGAFLMLMRVKEESAEEVAGFTRALRESIPTSANCYQPAVDWAAYAGKKRQLPWFLLAALTLAAQGYPVLMHGMDRQDERVYIPEALDALDMDVAQSINDAESQLQNNGFAYLPIQHMSPLTAELISSRELFGLRPPLHTVARMLNPFFAPLSVMGVFHPNFALTHQQAAILLEQPGAMICKGEGGEFERIPERSVDIYAVHASNGWKDNWNNLTKPGRFIKPERLNLSHFRSVWDGEEQDQYADLAVIGTLAWVIYAMQLETSEEKAHQLAKQWWLERHSGNSHKATLLEQAS